MLYSQLSEKVTSPKQSLNETGRAVVPGYIADIVSFIAE